MPSLRSAQPPASPCQKYQGRPTINLSHLHADIPLQDVQNKLRAVIELREDHELRGMLIQALRCAREYPSIKTVDLVAHSTSDDQTLLFGSYSLRPERDLRKLCQNVRTAVGDMPKKVTLRLVGCGTAGSQEGLEAMELIATELCLPVSGTTTIVLEPHFDEQRYIGRYLATTTGNGCARDDGGALTAAVGLWELPQELGIPSPRPDHFLPLPMVPGDSPLARVFQGLENTVNLQQAFAAPGLLLQPLFSRRLAVQLPGRAEAWLRADVLFDQRLLRLWPVAGAAATEGVIYPVSDRTDLDGVLSKLGFRPMLPR